MNYKQQSNNNHYSLLLMVILLVVLAVFSILRFSVLWSLSIWKSMAMQLPEFGIMAIGLVFCFISGNIDLSFIALADLAAIIGVKVMISVPDNSMIIPGILLALAIGAVGGYINGNLVSRLNIPPILATLATQQLFMGLAIAITSGNAVTNVPKIYTDIGHSMICGFIPFPLLLFAVLFLIGLFILKYTVFGKRLYMIGSNKIAARFSAINIKNNVILAYVINGIYAVIGGLIMVSSYNSAKADFGISYLMTCFLILVLAGVMPDGGMGKIHNVLIAILTVQIISTGVNMFAGINSYYRGFIWGVLLITMLIINTRSWTEIKRLMFKLRRKGELTHEENR